MLLLEENVGLDWLFRLRGPIEAPAEVVVISIDAESADALDLPPDPIRWPRSQHAELVRRLSATEAGVIVFDIMFDSHREETQDLEFTAAVRSAGNVVLLDRIRIDRVDIGTTGQSALLETRVPPISALASAALATAPFPLPRYPDKVSQFWVFGPSDPDVPTLPGMALHAHARDVHPTLMAMLDEIRPGSAPRFPGEPPSLSGTGALIRRALRNDTDLAEQLLSRLQAPTQPMTQTGLAEGTRAKLIALARMYAGPDSRYVNFYGPMRTVRTIPYHRIVSGDWEPAAFDLAGKVVFVGFSDELPIDQRDTFRTAFSERGQSLSGVEIGATALANLLSNASIQPLPLPWHYLLVLLWGGAIAAVFITLSTRAALAAAGTAGFAYVLTAAAVFRTGTLLPILVPVFGQIPVALLAVFAWNHHRAREFSERAKRTLGYYLPAQVVERLSRETSGVRPSSELLHGTCLVTDAAQYTALSERLRPRELHNLLNEYYAVLFSEIDRHGGFVSDVVGDSMVAMWANAKPDPVARASACRAAAAILLAVERFNAGHAAHRLPTRIGIHAGQVLLGDIGAESHFEYRAVGDIVNTATRIQELNKRLNTGLLVSGVVLENMPAAFTRCVGRFVLAGKSVPIELHDMISFDESPPSVQRELVHRFESALASFQARHWEEAAAIFEDLLGDFPGDGPSGFYLELSRRYHLADPGPSWSGEVVVTEK
ncbi:MAG TPA: adenylate/guanylate cyclase domain-containing protein [Gammaproteobacteria bacterium]|nr:adenylate/guanylate cyclase domain-containing protein [Gammaproteobacteria bacterium]